MEFLRVVHLVGGALYLLMVVLVGALIGELGGWEWDVYASYARFVMTEHATPAVPATGSHSTMPVGVVVLLPALLAGLFHAFNGAFFTHHCRELMHGTPLLTWVDYSVGQPLLYMVVAVLAGTFSVSVLVLIYFCGLAHGVLLMLALGLYRTGETRGHAILALATSSMLIVVIWGTILGTLGQLTSHASIPRWIPSVVVLQLVLTLGMLIIQVRISFFAPNLPRKKCLSLLRDAQWGGSSSNAIVAYKFVFFFLGGGGQGLTEFATEMRLSIRPPLTHYDRDVLILVWAFTQRCMLMWTLYAGIGIMDGLETSSSAVIAAALLVIFLGAAVGALLFYYARDRFFPSHYTKASSGPPATTDETASMFSGSLNHCTSTESNPDF